MDKIKETTKKWIDNNGRLKEAELTQGVKTAIHWISFGLIVLFGGRNAFSTNGTSHKVDDKTKQLCCPLLECLWNGVAKVMNSAAYKGQEPYRLDREEDGTPMIWYMEATDWPRENLEKVIISWAIDLLKAEVYDNLRGIAKRANLLPEEPCDDTSYGPEHYPLLRFTDPENPKYH